MINDKKTRRTFLQGSGGALLAIPYLPSVAALMGDTAFAQNMGMIKRFVYLNCDHSPHLYARVPYLSNGRHPVTNRNMGKGDSSFLNTYNADFLRVGEIPNDIGLAGSAYDVAILRNNAALRAKMNIYNNFGNTNGLNSRYAHRFPERLTYGLTADGRQDRNGAVIPSIDTYIANAIYPNNWPTTKRQIILGEDSRAVSSNLSGQGSGGQGTQRAFFNILFAGIAPTGTTSGSNPVADPRAMIMNSVIDNVMADKNRLLANSKISADDKRYVQEYLDYIRDFERSFAAQAENPGQALSCQPYSHTGETSDSFKNLVKASFMCDATRVFVYSQFQSEPIVNSWGNQLDTYGETHLNGAGDKNSHSRWHISYQHDRGIDIQRDLVSNVADFAKLLDDVKYPGTNKSLLDETLILAGHENGLWGRSTHTGEHPGDYHAYISFGGTDAMNTGLMFDTLDDNRNPINDKLWPTNNLLISFMRAMGLSPNQWGNNGIGYYAGGNTMTDSKGRRRNLVAANRNSAIPRLLKGA